MERTLTPTQAQKLREARMDRDRKTMVPKALIALMQDSKNIKQIGWHSGMNGGLSSPVWILTWSSDLTIKETNGVKSKANLVSLWCSPRHLGQELLGSPGMKVQEIPTPQTSTLKGPPLIPMIVTQNVKMPIINFPTFIEVTMSLTS